MIDKSTTYQQAKDIYFNAKIMQDNTISIDTTDSTIVRNFRKHLSEFEYRQQQGKRFTSRILDNNQLLVLRIK